MEFHIVCAKCNRAEKVPWWRKIEVLAESLLNKSYVCFMCQVEEKMKQSDETAKISAT